MPVLETTTPFHYATVDWQFIRYFMPCKQCRTVSCHVPHVSFSSPSQWYKDHPLFVVDEECVSPQNSITTRDITFTKGNVSNSSIINVWQTSRWCFGIPVSNVGTWLQRTSIIVNYNAMFSTACERQLVWSCRTSRAACPATDGIPLHAASGVQVIQSKERSAPHGKHQKHTTYDKSWLKAHNNNRGILWQFTNKYRIGSCAYWYVFDRRCRREPGSSWFSTLLLITCYYF